MKDPFSPTRVNEIDGMRVHETYAAWPELAQQGLEVRFRPGRVGLRKVYVLGMGGSAAAGDMLTGWLWSRHRVEAEVCKGVLEAHGMAGVLAIACSASGQTEETVSMMKAALEGGATIVSISSGGRLEAESKNLGVPHIRMPRGLAPRYMFPFMAFSCFKVVDEALGLGSAGEAKGAIIEMRRLRSQISVDVPTTKNPAKKLALRLMNKTPVIYGTRATRGVGVRFKNSVNENAKKHAAYEEMPELFHNEVQAWEEPGTSFAPVILRDDDESDRDSRLADAFTGMLASMGKAPLEVRGEGGTSFARLTTMVYKLDLASYYIAIGRGTDPFPVPLIVRLKKAA